MAVAVSFRASQEEEEEGGDSMSWTHLRVRSVAGNRWLYGGSQPRIELACKAIGHDLKGAVQYANAAAQLARSSGPHTLSGSSGLNDCMGKAPFRVPMQCLLEYRGIRINAMPWLPLKKLVCK